MIEHTSSLSYKRQDISSDKDLGQPVHPDDGEVSSVEHPNHPTQDHVDGRSEEGRSQEDCERLHDIGTLFPFRLVLRCLDGSSDISDGLDCFVQLA